MKNSEVLMNILAAAGVDGTVLDAQSAGLLAQSLGFDRVTEDDFVLTLASSAEWDGDGAPNGEFELRVGKWRLDIAELTTEAITNAAILSGTLVAMGATDIKVAVLAGILPSLVDIESVTLTEGEKGLLIEVRRLPNVTNRLIGIDDLYEQLPADIKRQVNQFDFADFIERLNNADEAFMSGGRVRVRKEGENPPMISWK